MPARQPKEAGVRRRLREARLRTFGERGATRFARAVGVHVSTWRRYESDRLPPMPILLKTCEVSGLDIRWLLTGQFSQGTRSGAAVGATRASREALGRFAHIVNRRPKALPALIAMIDLLDDARELSDVVATLSPVPTSGGAMMIPVLGRTAAGVPHFWRDGSETDILIHAATTGNVTYKTNESGVVSEEHVPQGAGEESIRLVELNRPTSFAGASVSQCLDAPRFLKKHPRAFALRVDGDSMKPRIRHGQFVIVSPDQPAREGRTAVVQLKNQIGAVCKLFRCEKDRVHLIPINEAFPTTRHDRRDLLWALEVLGLVRLNTDD